MNKNELVALVAESADLTKTDATKALNSVLESIASALKKGDTVSLTGFGTFAVSRRAASTGRNPRTGDTIKIAASNRPSFRAGKGLKDAVN